MLTACGSDETVLTYRLKFGGSQLVNTRVTFPEPLGAYQEPIRRLVRAFDGGSISYLDELGGGVALDGLGSAEAFVNGAKVKGLETGTSSPNTQLSMTQPDAGVGDLYVHVNKAGASVVNIEFEYTATRSCGPGCGGKRSWKFSGPVGAALQPIHADYVEEKY